MALQEEFHSIFRQEIEAHFAKLQRMALAPTPPPRPPPASAPSEPGSKASSPVASSWEASYVADSVVEKIDYLQPLASQMAENILRRLANYAPERGLDAAAGIAAAEHQGTAAGSHRGESDRSGERAQLEARCCQLEDEIRHKKQATARRIEEAFAKVKREFAVVLDAREQDLVDVQQRVSSDAAVASTDDQSRLPCTALVQNFVESMDVIGNRLADARLTVDEITSKKRGLENSEALERRERGSKVQEWLHESCGLVGEAEEDDQDFRVRESIERGEQLCKRLRTCLAGSGT